MSQGFFSPELSQRPLDILAMENALVDMLVRASETDLTELKMHKGVMQLVDSEKQAWLLGNLGKLTTEVELGGSAANAVRAMAALGCKASYTSCVGHDPYGRTFSNRLEELSILNRLATVQDATGTCVVLVTPDGERTLNTHLGACQHYTKSFLPVNDFAKAKIFFSTGYILDTQNQIEAFYEAVQLAKVNHCKIAFDVADPFVIHRSGDQIKEFMNGSIDILFANAEEAQMLVGCSGKEAAIKIGQKVPVAVVKDGSKGAYIIHNQELTFIPAEKANVIDTTGAGDMFAGGFMAGICKQKNWHVAGLMGSKLAADTIQHMGVRLKPETITELMKL